MGKRVSNNIGDSSIAQLISNEDGTQSDPADNCDLISVAGFEDFTHLNIFLMMIFLS